MKKVAIFILVSVFLLFVTAETGKYVKGVRDEATYRREYALRLSKDPKLLACFLFTTGELDEFVEVDSKDYSKTINYAVEVFSEDEDTNQKALDKAKEVLAVLWNGPTD